MTRIRLALTVLALALVGLLFAAPAKADRPSLKKVECFNLPVASNANVISSSLTPDSAYPGAAYRITIGLDATDGADSIVEVRVTSGSDSIDFDLNDGTALTKGRLYTFSFGASTSYTFNLQCETETVIGYLLVEEIQDGEL